MKRKLTRTGNSLTLVVTREMREHLGMGSSVREIEVTYRTGEIVLRAPERRMSFEEAVGGNFEQFDAALRNLAK